MIRIAFVCVFLAGCAGSPFSASSSSSMRAAQGPAAHPEVHRGLVQKSSPDSGQSPAGDGLGGWGGPGR